MLIPRKRLFWAVGLGHLTNDTFMSMGPVLLAFMSTSILPMTNAQIGFAESATQLVNATSQPVFGYLTDRNGGRWLGALGVLWNASILMVALVIAHVTRQYWLMLIPWLLRALGSGAFHPVGALHAAESNPIRAASNLSWFFLLGQIGLASGPALAGILLEQLNRYNSGLSALVQPVMPTPIFQQVNLTALVVLLAAALPAVLLMAVVIPGRKAHRAGMESEAKTRKRIVRADVSLKPIILLALLVVFRSLGQPGTVVFFPVLFQQKGWSPAEYGLITSSFWIASGIAGVFFGNLADRYDRRYIVAFSLLVSVPAFFFLPIVDGLLAFALAVIAGGFSGASHSIIVVLAQELIPVSKGFASGAIMGFIFGTGALGSFIIGGVADLITLGTTFQLVAGTVLIASLLALALPVRKPPIVAARSETGEVGAVTG